MCTPMNGHSLPLELHIPLFLDLACYRKVSVVYTKVRRLQIFYQ